MNVEFNPYKVRELEIRRWPIRPERLRKYYFMHVSFVLPPFDLSAAYGSTTKMKRGFLPSLGVGHLAAMVQARGHTVSLIDAQVLDLDPIQTVDAILREDPAIVALSVLNVYAHAAYAVAQALKERAPDKLIVMGGAHCTAVHKKVLEECPPADVVVPGEGEIPFAELVDAYSRNEDYRAVKGIYYRDDEGAVVYSGHARIIEDLDEIPAPARHIYAPYEYRALPNQVRREPSTTSITSRGCSWGKCTFCFQGGEYSPKYRRRSPRHVVDELIPLVREHGNKEIIFWDDTFAVNSRWIDEFCDLLDKEKLDISWSCYGHMRAVNPTMLKRMSKSGCYNIYYGFESGVQELLDLIKKGTSRDQIRETVKWTRAAGMELRGSFILGLPTETPEQSLETIKFACELNCDWMMFYPFNIQPGTPIEALAHADGVVIEDQRTLHFPAFVSSGYEDREQVHAMVNKAYRTYYMRPRYWGRVLWNISRRPYVAKYYLDAVKFWFELTRGAHRVESDQSSKTEATSSTS